MTDAQSTLRLVNKTMETLIRVSTDFETIVEQANQTEMSDEDRGRLAMMAAEIHVCGNDLIRDASACGSERYLEQLLEVDAEDDDE